MVDYAKVLETYSFSEIFEMNDLSDDEVLEYLVDRGYVTLPSNIPVDAL